MKFQGYRKLNYLIVEFSETGNAAYILPFAEFEKLGVAMHTSHFELKRHLKFDDTHRIIHSGDWEPKAEYKLAAEFGITP
jgi:hypothetical protein